MFHLSKTFVTSVEVPCSFLPSRSSTENPQDMKNDMEEPTMSQNKNNPDD